MRQRRGNPLQAEKRKEEKRQGKGREERRESRRGRAFQAGVDRPSAGNCSSTEWSWDRQDDRGHT